MPIKEVIHQILFFGLLYIISENQKKIPKPVYPGEPHTEVMSTSGLRIDDRPKSAGGEKNIQVVNHYTFLMKS